MDALVLKHANAMPAKTWHRLHMNDTCVEIPAGLSRACAATAEVTDESIFGRPGAFEKAVARAQAALDAKLAGKPEDTRAVLVAANGSAAADDAGGVPSKVFSRNDIGSRAANARVNGRTTTTSTPASPSAQILRSFVMSFFRRSPAS